MTRLVSAVAFVLAWSSLAVGQSTLPCTVNCQLQKGQPFSIVYNWAPTVANPDAADGFKLYRNGVVVAEGGSNLLQNGIVSFGFQTGIQTTGSYSFAVAAYTTTGGESVGDPVLVTIMKGKPAKPTNGRVQ
jgi:hypothetical protein